jgi:hypothetical protein
MIKINTHIKNREEVYIDVPSGFTMIFENGNTISVQFGQGNYCSNKGESKDTSDTAEIAMWNKEGDWYQIQPHDEVKGYCNADEVAKWIHFAATTEFKKEIDY